MGDEPTPASPKIPGVPDWMLTGRTKKLAEVATVATTITTTAFTVYRKAKTQVDKHLAGRRYQVSISTDDPLYDDIHDWVLATVPPVDRKALRVGLERRRRTVGYDSPAVADSPSSGRKATPRGLAALKMSHDEATTHSVRIKGHTVDVTVQHPGPTNTKIDPEDMSDMMRRWYPGKIILSTETEAARDDILAWIADFAEARLRGENPPEFHVAIRGAYWERIKDVPSRTLESVVLADGVLDGLIGDMTRFLADRSRYDAFSVPYHRGYALVGPPGCLAGDTPMQINRAGKTYRCTLAELVRKQNGGLTKGFRWREDIPTRVQRNVDGLVRLGTISAAWESGIKTTFTVTTETGRTIRATDEHPFMTVDGWKRLGEITVGDGVLVATGRSSRGRTKVHYPSTYTKYHPNQRRAKDGFRCFTHRLTMEANVNGLSFGEFVRVLRTDPVRAAEFTYLTSEQVVHHRDGNPKNNDPTNLLLTDHSSHWSEHDWSANVAEQIGTEAIVSIECFGEEMTYDIEVEDDPHNFLANGFVVHNTGKTSIVKALASHFALDLWYIPLGDVVDDSSLMSMIVNIGGGGILLLEDIDVFQVARNRAEGDTEKVTLSGLLNTLDGIATPSGLITIVTANRPEVLDGALIRKGRIDRVDEIGYLAEPQAVELFTRWYGQPPTAELGVRADVAPAELVELMKLNWEDPEQAEKQIIAELGVGRG